MVGAWLLAQSTATTTLDVNVHTVGEPKGWVDWAVAFAPSVITAAVALTVVFLGAWRARHNLDVQWERQRSADDERWEEQRKEVRRQFNIQERRTAYAHVLHAAIGLKQAAYRLLIEGRLAATRNLDGVDLVVATLDTRRDVAVAHEELVGAKTDVDVVGSSEARKEVEELIDFWDADENAIEDYEAVQWPDIRGRYDEKIKAFALRARTEVGIPEESLAGEPRRLPTHVP